MGRFISRVVWVVVLVTGSAAVAQAQDEEAEAAPPVTVSGWVEGFYQWNFNDPSNGITHLRGYDDRHNTFTLSNAVVDVVGTHDALTGHIALQVGRTAATAWLFEPTFAGAASTGPSDQLVWRHLQQANLGWTHTSGLLLEAGLFLSPIGPESLAVKDDWTYSRSNLFFGLPAYHAGARVTYPLSDALKITAHVYNGWNTLVDNNEEKSFALSLSWNAGMAFGQVLAFSGVERNEGAPEGDAWRNQLDAYAQIDATDALSILIHANVGFEPNDIGTSWWIAGALAARYAITPWFFAAVRGDWFQEQVGEDDAGMRAGTIFWPTTNADGVARVAEVTASLDVRPTDHVSFRLEYRHDAANADMYFDGDVATDMTTGAFIPDAQTQDTVTLGAVAWF